MECINTDDDSTKENTKRKLVYNRYQEEKEAYKATNKMGKRDVAQAVDETHTY